jgi:hypothetical protein
MPCYLCSDGHSGSRPRTRQAVRGRVNGLNSVVRSLTFSSISTSPRTSAPGNRSGPPPREVVYAASSSVRGHAAPFDAHPALRLRGGKPSNWYYGTGGGVLSLLPQVQLHTKDVGPDGQFAQTPLNGARGTGLYRQVLTASNDAATSWEPDAFGPSR